MSDASQDTRRRIREMMAGLNMTQRDVAREFRGGISEATISRIMSDPEQDLADLEQWISARYEQAHGRRT